MPFLLTARYVDAERCFAEASYSTRGTAERAGKAIEREAAECGYSVVTEIEEGADDGKPEPATHSTGEKRRSPSG